MYRPRDWPSLASVIAETLGGNGTRALNTVQLSINISDTSSAQDAFYTMLAVLCVDGPDVSTEYQGANIADGIQAVLSELINGYHQTSQFFVGSFLGPWCLAWKARNVERFTEPFNSSLANPILIVSNTADVRLSARRLCG
jgi:hypothetical protein